MRCPHPLRRISGRIAAVLVIVVAVVALTGWRLSAMHPSWWHDPVEQEASAQASAAATEAGLVELATRVDATDAERDDAGGRVWAVRLDQQQLNDWLAVRLPAWLRHGGIGDVPQVQVQLAEGEMVVGVRPDGEARIYSIVLRAERARDGIRIHASGGSIGRLPVPVGIPAWIDELIEGAAAGSTEPVAQIASAVLKGQSLGPLDLGDGRRVEVIDVEVRVGELRLRCRTGP